MTTATSARPVTTAPIDLDQTFLPVAQMRQITRVTLFDGATIEGEMDLGAEHWVYPQHFPGDPIFPGTLLIEAAGQLVALWAWGQGQRGRPRLVRASAEFHCPVYPATARLSLRATVRGKRHLCFGSTEVVASGTLIATIEAVLAVIP